MKKFLSFLIVIFVAWGLLVTDADARRFGGGRSFGYQRSVSNYSRPSAMPFQNSQNSGNRWLGPLAGLAMGGLLASLFMGHGLGGALLSWLLVGGVVLMIFNAFRARSAPYARAYSPQQETTQSFVNPYANSFTGRSQYPADFDPADFLRTAKVQFMRLQAAYDAKNLTDLREFTAPEVFAEIQMQLQEQQGANHQTEVISLEAELVDVSQESAGTLASVIFKGAVREEANSPIEAISETWHFQRYPNSTKWLLVGLQQN